MPKVVLDTNVLLDIFIFKDPSVIGIWELATSGNLDFFYSSATLEEFKNLLADEKFSCPAETQKEALQSFLTRSTLVEPAKLFPVKCKDPDDQKFLDLAISISPAYLVSWDKAVLKLRKRSQKEGFSILTPPAFLKALMP